MCEPFNPAERQGADHAEDDEKQELKGIIMTAKECFTDLRLRQAKFDNGGSILSSSQFSLLPEQPLKLLKWSKSTQNTWIANNDLNP
jgi:hypothetical protein